LPRGSSLNPLILLVFFAFLCAETFAQQKNAASFFDAPNYLLKQQGQSDRRQGIHSGNQIRTLFYNYGTIGFPYTQPGVEWPKGSNHNYIFEFGVIAAAEVVDAFGDTVQIVDDGIIGGRAGEGGDVAPTGEVWGWQPLPGFAAEGQNGIAMSDDPSTWPDSWPNRPESWDGEWIGEYGKGLVIADQESYYVMDDRDNKEFAYFPFINDSSRRGLGLQVEVRGYQWSQTLAEDCIFWVFEVTNTSDKDLEKVVFGMYGDADVGGAEDWSDDDSFFDVDRDMVYQWDNDNRGIWGGEVGYFGFKYLESPGNPFDGIDNDGDGLTDERRDDNIDNDGDWRADRDDVGADGVEDTDDEGEGDGRPTHGEPNFDETDIDESDQIGLTSFNSFVWPSVRVADDLEMWNRLMSGNFPQPAQTVDIVFLYGSGNFKLEAGQTQRFSIALLLGENQKDLFRNADVVQKIYNSNYRFAKAPDKPTMTAVAGDGEVTLYWDSKAELSVDPVSGDDFEGYRIYRATDPGFNEVRTITDGDGNLTLYEPIAQFDLDNNVSGFHPVDFNGVKYYLGNNSGLQHSWKDTTVINGLTYYYAVVSYDRGDTLALIPPTECTKVIGIDEASNLKPDINTAIVTPNNLPTNYSGPSFSQEVQRVRGKGTGLIDLRIIDPNKIEDNATYEIAFYDSISVNFAYQVNKVDGNSTEVKIGASSLFEGEDANPVFDGIQLFVTDDPLEYDPKNTGWINGESNYSHDSGLFLNGIMESADYEIRFGDGREDDIFGVPAPFDVWNVTEDRPNRFALIDNDVDKTWSLGDDIVFLQGESGTVTTWKVTFKEPADSSAAAIAPEAGDIFYFATYKPFAHGDVFSFSTKAAGILNEGPKSLLDNIAVIPNPYVATNITEPVNNLQSGRGERRISFINIPAGATIRIFTITGNLVKTLQNDSGLDSGTITWDLLSKDNIGVAFGVYIYHVDAPGIGTKISKFALIK
jgi:hypothetical protein